MDVTITNNGGRISIIDLRGEEESSYNVLKDGLRIFQFGDVVRIQFIDNSWIDILYTEVGIVNNEVELIPDTVIKFTVYLNNILADYVSGEVSLESLSDVEISAPTAGDVLSYDDELGVWINSPAGGGGGGDMYKSVYDTDNDGSVDKSETVQIIVRNSTGVTLTKGQIVYLDGATGNRPNAVLAMANSEATSSKTIGWVVQDIENNSDGYVGVSGSAHNLDTSAFDEGDSLWLSPSVPGGVVANMPPVTPDHSVFIGIVARSHPNQGRIIYAIQNGYEIGELHDVLIDTPQEGDSLTYDSADGIWKNVPQDKERVLILSQDASSSATIEFVNLFTADYTRFEVEIDDALPQVAGAIKMEIGTGSTPTWQTGGTAYGWISNRILNTGTGTSPLTFNQTDGQDSAMTLLLNFANLAVENSFSGTIVIYNPLQDFAYHQFTFLLSEIQNPVQQLYSGKATYWATTPITSIRFYSATGNLLRGNFRLYGYK